MMWISERHTLIEIFDDEYGYGSYFFFNDFLSLWLVACFAILPFFVMVFYCKKFNRLGDQDFNDTYGSTYDGLRTDDRSILFFPVFFLIRRYIFIFMAFKMSAYPSLFLFILLAMTMVAAMHLLVGSPFNSSLLLRLEFFNEMTSMVLLYTSLCLTWFIPEGDSMRDTVGTFFIVVMGINCIVHLFYMVRSTVIDCKQKVKAKKREKAIAAAAKLNKDNAAQKNQSKVSERRSKRRQAK